MKHAPNDYALVIGVNDYPRWNDGRKSLRGSVKDAQEFRNWLVKDEGGGLPCSNVKLVLSTSDPLGPRQQVIDDAFRELRDVSEGKTRRRFYFYFSGHGHSRAGSFGQQSLCLANWSPVDAGAALHLESYIKSSVGCLKFSEALFFLDCCRVRQIAPLGHSSELECGDPQMADRSSAIIFGTEQYTPTYEGDVAEEVRGYFTAGLLQVLGEGTIELRDMIDRLKEVVPRLAKPKDQVVRAVPADTKIYLGPPAGDPPPRVRANAAGVKAVDEVRAIINIRTNLIERNDSGNPEEPGHPGDPMIIRPGEISVFHGETLVARGTGSLDTYLAPGPYELRIDHGEASNTCEIIISDKPFKETFDLPRRRSASLLSSTIDKHEWLTDPAVETSRWVPAMGEQAAFISLRSSQAGMPIDIDGELKLNGQTINQPNTLLREMAPGTITLSFTHHDGNKWEVPVPIAAGWDTQIFVIVDRGRPQLGTSSVSMRPAGTGFHPGDALVDAYERSIADLVTEGPGPDEMTLSALLYGKFRNPLFGVLGAHFLIRKLRRAITPDADDLDRLEFVTRNLEKLLGFGAPDVVALRLWKGILCKESELEEIPDSPPLFNVGFQAFVIATAWRQRDSAFAFEKIALGLDANSPWTVWKDYYQENTDLAAQVLPESIVSYVAEAREQADRASEPLDFKRLVRRTMLPKSVLVRAAEVSSNVLGSMAEGQIVEGKVKNITDYGAFVDLGGIDGLLHVTDMSYKRVGHPSEVLNIGDVLRVQIVRINRETQRISLGMKQLEADPWTTAAERYAVDSKHKGRVTNITEYGAFVELEPGIEGLVHVSEMSWVKKNVHPGKIVSTSQEVEVIVLEVDEDKRRISLGLKQAQRNPWEVFAEQYPVGTIVEGEVKNTTEFGLFVDLDDDVDGMVHMSDIAWGLTGEQALAAHHKGERVKAVVLEVDVEKERISLGIKQLDETKVSGGAAGVAATASGAGGDFRKNQIVTATVVEARDGGLEVQVGEDGPLAFIKRGDLSRDRDEQRAERFQVGQKVDAMVIGFDKGKKPALSIKAMQITEEKQAVAQYGSSDSGASLDDILRAVPDNTKLREAD